MEVEGTVVELQVRRLQSLKVWNHWMFFDGVSRYFNASPAEFVATKAQNVIFS